MRSSADLVKTWATFKVQTWCRPWVVILGSSADRAGLWGGYTGVRGRARAYLRVPTLARMRKERKKGLHGLHFRFKTKFLGSARGLHFRFIWGLHGVFTFGLEVCFG